MKTRNEVIEALEVIEGKLKAFNVEADNNGNFERTEDYQTLIEEEDNLMTVLQQFPL